MRKIKTAVIGTGFMGRVHTEAIRRLGNVEVAAVAAENEGLAAAFAQATGVEKTVTDYHKLLEDPQIEAVHICTPNALHYPIAKAAMLAGKHVLCEKPLAVSSAEARELVEIARKQGVANCLNHNLRFYPLVQQVRAMIQNGELGEILVVQGTYSQDWLLYDTDWNWRVVAQDNGPLRVMGDIGSHWMDTIMHLTGLEITGLCADLQIFHQTRKRPKVAVETFAGKTLRPEDFDEVPIETEDFGAVLLRLGGRARGAFTVSQVNAGCKNRFQFEIYGSKAGVIWNQETPDLLWIGHRNEPNQLIVKDPSLLDVKARGYADLPGGHSEGYDDAHKMCFRRFYARVADPAAPIEYPTFEDGYHMLRILEKVIESSKTRAWVDIEPAQ
ncbi:MAG: Gfo/Idh/MocA family oxidoreductase [Bryobacteraceae bacterium]|jgi:predicted dehydrogenase